MSRESSPPPVSLKDCAQSEFLNLGFKIEQRAPLTDREITLARLCVRAIAEDLNAQASAEARGCAPHDFAVEDDYPFQDACGLSELIDSGGNLRLRGKVVKVRWVNQWYSFKNEGGDETYFVGLAYDARGTFYGITGVAMDSDIRRVAIEKLTGKRALAWFASRFSHCEKFTRELCRAIENPAFEFMDIVPTRTAPKRTKKAGKAAAVFHEQLHLATALVECVRKLDAQPSLENLGDACRSVSQLHLAIHAPENFKLAAHS